MGQQVKITMSEETAFQRGYRAGTDEQWGDRPFDQLPVLRTLYDDGEEKEFRNGFESARELIIQQQRITLPYGFGDERRSRPSM